MTQKPTETTVGSSLSEVLDQLRNADVYGNVPAGTPWRVAFETAATVLAADMDADVEVDAFDPDWVVAPGDLLEGWRLGHHLTVKKAQAICGRMDLQFYLRIEEGKQKLTPGLAAQLERGTGIPASLWLKLERAYRAGLKARKAREKSE